MVFNSYIFFVFLGLVLVVTRATSDWKVRKALLLLFSYLFYAAWNPPFVGLLWISTIADWYLSKAIYDTKSAGLRKLLLTSSLALNLGLLAIFKYGQFALNNAGYAASILGLEWSPGELSIILPVGISFYTFQTLSYTIDVYRGELKPWSSFLDYALYVTFFPQLVAGPIVRATDFLPQCTEPKIATPSQLGWGMNLVVYGLFLKVFIADALMAPVVQAVYDQPLVPDMASAWIGTFAFAIQIYCDFAGYSYCAIGSALCLGFALPDNFRFPYAASGFSDFWRRWHISLSTWLRDYLYISLGGNRGGRAMTLRNLSLTMLLGGLWHGASWNFVVWGALHGLFLIMERLLRDRFGTSESKDQRTVASALKILFTFVLVCFTWIFFRAATLSQASSIAASFLGLANPGLVVLLSKKQVAVTLFVTAATLFYHWKMRDKSLEDATRLLHWSWRSTLTACMLIATLLTMSGADVAFIYFQF